MLKSLHGRILGSLALAGMFGATVQAQEMHSVEAVKAAYLYRFAAYVEWPQETVAAGPFVIVVVGDHGIANELRRLVPEHQINKQVVQVKEVTTVAQIGNAQILYVGTGNDAILRSLAAGARHSMLVVSDDERGLDLGSVLNFVTVDNRVRFEVSLSAADRAQLKISADLLSVAIRVHGGNRQSDYICIPFALHEDGETPCNIRQARSATQHPLAASEKSLPSTALGRPIV